MSQKTIHVWYLFHSGFALKIDDHLLIFDYYLETPIEKPADSTTGIEPSLFPSFDQGIVLPEDFTGHKVYVFSSHRHYDHYRKLVFDWEIQHEDTTYIMSDDIKKPKGTKLFRVAPHQTITIDDLVIRTLKSNDAGVAYHVTLGDIGIYFSGDLNWWYWPEESKEWNDGIEQVLKEEWQMLKDLPLDIAFLPVDPRLGEAYTKSLTYFTDEYAQADTKIFPMHFGENHGVFNMLEKDGFMNDKRIMKINRRGERFYV